METIVGIKGKDYVMLCADSSHPHSIMLLKDGKYCTNLTFLTNTVNDSAKKQNLILQFPFQMKTRSSKSPTHCWLQLLEMPAIQFSLSSTFPKTFCCTRCETATRWAQRRLLITHERTLLITCEPVTLIKWTCWWPVTIKPTAHNSRSSIIWPTLWRWIMEPTDTEECSVAAFWTSIIMRVSTTSVACRIIKPTQPNFLDITQDEAYDVLKKCAREIQKRMIINQNRFHVMVVDANGVRRLEDLTADNLKQ